MKKNFLIRSLSGCVLLAMSSFGFAQPLTNLFVATGQGLGSILDVSTDGGKSWSLVQQFYHQQNYFAGNPSCFGHGDSAMCVVTGGVPTESMFDPKPTVVNFPPELIVTHDGGNSWNMQRIKGLPPYNMLSVDGASCFEGENGDPRCVISGGYGLPNGGWAQNYIAVGHDHGETWIAQPVKGILPKSVSLEFNGNLSCTGKGKEAVCAVGAQDLNTEYVISSMDGGETWRATNLSDTGGPMSCTGNGANAVCIEPGYQFAVTNDGARTWSIKASPLGNSLFATGVSCTGNGVNASCVVIGANEDTNAPVLLLSQDAGNTWSDKSSLLPAAANLESVSCTGESVNSVCVVTGNLGIDKDSSSPFIITSNDNGNSWSSKTIAGSSALGDLRRVTCKGDGTAATCVAEGYQIPQTQIPFSRYGYAPLLAVSTDKGNTWNAPTVQGMPIPAAGILGQ